MGCRCYGATYDLGPVRNALVVEPSCDPDGCSAYQYVDVAKVQAAGLPTDRESLLDLLAADGHEDPEWWLEDGSWQAGPDDEPVFVGDGTPPPPPESDDVPF